MDQAVTMSGNTICAQATADLFLNYQQKEPYMMP